MNKRESDETYSDAETARRRDQITRNLIAMPPRLHAPLKAKKKARRPKATKKASRKA